MSTHRPRFRTPGVRFPPGRFHSTGHRQCACARLRSARCRVHCPHEPTRRGGYTTHGQRQDRHRRLWEHLVFVPGDGQCLSHSQSGGVLRHRHLARRGPVIGVWRGEGLLHGRTAGGSGHPDCGEPYHAAVPHGGQSRGHRGGQARLYRETAGGDAGAGCPHPGGRAAEGGTRRLRAGHFPGCWPADVSQTHRRRRHRQTRGGFCLHDEPWARVLAPRSRLLLPGWCRAHVRYGPLLPDGPHHAARPYRSRCWHGGYSHPGTDHYQQAQVRRKDRCPHAGPRHGDVHLCVRRHRHDHHDVRDLAVATAAHRDLWHGGDARRAGSEHASRAGTHLQGRH